MDDAEIEAFGRARARKIGLAMTIAGLVLIGGSGLLLLSTPGPEHNSGEGRMWMGGLGTAVGVGLTMLIPGVLGLVRGKDDGVL